MTTTGQTASGDLMSELMASLEQSQEALKKAEQELSAVAEKMPRPGVRVIGHDEGHRAEITVDHLFRVVDARLEDSLVEPADVNEDAEDRDSDRDDDDHDDDAAKVAGLAGKAVIGAYRDALEVMLDPERPGAESQVIPAPRDTPPAPAPSFPRLAYVEPGQWPSRARYDEWERLRREADAALERMNRPRDEHAVVEGHDEERRVTVTVAVSGVLQNVTFDERRIEGVRGSALTAALKEALDDAYATIDAGRGEEA